MKKVLQERQKVLGQIQAELPRQPGPILAPKKKEVKAIRSNQSMSRKTLKEQLEGEPFYCIGKCQVLIHEANHSPGR